MILRGDCLDKLKGLAENSIDAVVTDPPAGIAFMNKSWDSDKGGRDHWIKWLTEIMLECKRVLKPGGHAFVWALPRTSHWTATAIENAGFDVRDICTHIFGSGFPKSADVSKMIDKQEYEKWSKIIKAIDSINKSDILSEWLEPLRTVKFVTPKSSKNTTATGMNTPLSDFVAENVLVFPNPEKCTLTASIAGELSKDPRLMQSGQISIAVGNAEVSPKPPSLSVECAENKSADQEPWLNCTPDITVPCVAKVLLSENTEQTTKAGEALMIWLGKQKSSKLVGTTALCAVLTDAWKHTILNQSEIFQSLDTKSQTDFASAITATITRSTAENLISYTVDTLRSKAIDKMHGAEDLGPSPYADKGRTATNIALNNNRGPGVESSRERITTPATPDAIKWQGWGTALKPASEHWILARKPLEHSLTIAQNVLKWGVGGINIDISRIKPNDEADHSKGQELLVSPSVYAGILLSLPDSFSGFCALSLSTVRDLLSHISSEPLACNIGDKASLHSLACALRTLNNESLDVRDGCDLPGERVSERAQNSLKSLNSQFGYPTLRRLCGAMSQTSKAFGPSDVPSLPDVLADISCALNSQENIPLTGNNLHLFCAWVFAWAVCTAKKSDIQDTSAQGRFPANLILGCACESDIHDEGCAVAMLDAQSGVSKSRPDKRDEIRPDGNTYGTNLTRTPNDLNDSGGASRFFFCAKASKRERNAGCEGIAAVKQGARPNSKDMSGKFPDHDHRPSGGNNHPTVKPIRLMEYLIRLICPPGGICLDPFAGSGSTGVAAKRLGFEFIGIEISEEYAEIAEKRIGV